MSMAQSMGRANGFSRCVTGSWPAILSGCLLMFLAGSSLTMLAASWQFNPDYSHGWLLLPVVLWLVLRAQPWTATAQPEPSLGAMTMLAGGVLHLASLVVPWPLLDYAGWVLLLRGLALQVWGRDAASRLMPVLAYAVLLFPLPASWLNAMAMTLQDAIAQIAEWALSIFWVCHRRGHQLYLAGLDDPLSVAVECSGIRQVMIFLALAWLLSFFVRGSFWRKAALVAASVPLAIAANVVRVILLAVLVRLLGPGAIAGWLHDLPLLLTLPLGAVMLWWCYGWLNAGSKEHSPRAARSNIEPVDANHGYVLLIGILSLLLCLQFGLQLQLAGIEKTPQMTQFSFDALPWQLGRWKGIAHPEEQKVKSQAHFADSTLVRAYSDERGRAVAVYLVYSATGQDRLHHPEICLRDAGGAAELKSDRSSIALVPGSSRLAERFRYQRHRGERTLVYYWHYTIMPQVTRDQSYLQRLYLKQFDQWPSITVQVQTNLSDPGAWKAIESTMLPELDQWLSSQLPVGTVVGSSRLAVRWTGEH